jgi:aspartate dehydrogenase
MKVINVTLIGFGAIGQAIVQRLRNNSQIKIAAIVVRESSLAAVRKQVDKNIFVSTSVPAGTQLILECAGHEALHAHVVPALENGIECAILSVGALSESGLAERLQTAAQVGGSQLHLLAGAIGGIDAISAARTEGLTFAQYSGRKPPGGWKGSNAEALLDLAGLDKATVFFEGSARQAALLYPKNANVAATVSLASLGLDATQVRLIADPAITENIHEIEVRGAFGQINISMRGKPLAENPKTSALTVMSAMRFLHNRVSHFTL